MLEAIGAQTAEELFTDIPEQVRAASSMDLPGPLPEFDLAAYFGDLAADNGAADQRNLFMGAGAYTHHVPAAVDQLLLRTEFFTCYTPYQPEVSQGTLMAIYEFQTYTAALTGMDIANASMYDGASGMAEAAIMACRLQKKNRVVVSSLVHPHWRHVLETYTRKLGIEIITADGVETGVTSRDALAEAANGHAAAVIVQSPNFFGNIEDLAAVREVCDASGAMFVAAVAEPVSLGVLKGPGSFGADVTVAEGRSFGGSLGYGGPGLGMFAVKKEFARQMPGRLVGKTKDTEGREGYTLTLATREQHIRRERATSNICSNQALCATAAAIHISLLGRNGLAELAERNMAAAAYMAERIGALKGFERVFDKPFFNEVAFHLPVEPGLVNQRLKKEGIVGGLDLSRYYPQLESAALFCATEIHSKKSVDRMVEILSEFER